MKKQGFIVLILISFIFFSTLGCDKNDPIETKGHITGLVTKDGSNTPIKAAEVTLLGYSQNYKTGSDGKYEIKDLAEQDYTVVVNKSGYITNKKQVTVKAGKTTNLDFSLEEELPLLNVTPEVLNFGSNLTKMTFSITNQNPKTALNWQIEEPENTPWIILSNNSGTTTEGETVITVTVDRDKMPEEKSYNISLIIKSTNGGGSKTVNIIAEKIAGQLSANPNSLDFGQVEVEKTLVLTNLTQEGTISYKATGNESWISNITNAENTISNDEQKTLKITISREGLESGNYQGNITITSNKNTVTISVLMGVVATTAPIIGNIENNNTAYNNISVSATISSVGNQYISAYGFCWSTSPNPDINQEHVNLGGINEPKSFDYNITNLTPNTVYYIKGYATNSLGTSYTNEIQVTTLNKPILATVTTNSITNIKANSAILNGTIEHLGYDYITDYGFCYTIDNAEPNLSNNNISLGSTEGTGTFSHQITNLTETTKYYVRAYATNSKGTAYGLTQTFTTANQPPVVTDGLLAYYTFDDGTAKDVMGNTSNDGTIQGVGNNPTLHTDTPNGKGQSVEFTNEKYYMITSCPDKSYDAITYAVWVKMIEGFSDTTNKCIYGSLDNFSSSSYNILNRRISVSDKYVYWSNIGGANFDFDTSGLLLDNNWHQLTITTEDSIHYNLYIDGKFYKTDHSLKKTAESSNYALIGYRFKGIIDNLRIYNRSLTQEEIEEIYNAKQ